MSASKRFLSDARAFAVEVVAPDQNWVTWATEAAVAVILGVSIAIGCWS